MNIYLHPAYGRQYDTLEKGIAAWNAGKDFKIAGGPYCSIRDIEKLKRDFDCVSIRFHTLKGMEFYIVSKG